MADTETEAETGEEEAPQAADSLLSIIVGKGILTEDQV
jgi:hypothetical protein